MSNQNASRGVEERGEESNEEEIPGTIVIENEEDRDSEKYIFLKTKVGAKGIRALLRPLSALYSAQKKEIPIEKMGRYSEKKTPSLDDVYLNLTLRQTKQGPTADWRSVSAARTKFLVYQFRPLCKFLEHPSKRLLIADEVGLGKTIEAGYILLEEMARTGMERVLIVCPSHLRYKWKRELWNKFGIIFTPVSGKGLLAVMEAGDMFHFIVSMDSMRNYLNRLRKLMSKPSVRLDMLVFDEVHNLIGRSGDTIRREMGLLLSLNANRVIAISATPIQLYKADLLRVFQILDPGSISEEEFNQEMGISTILHGIGRILGKTGFGKEELSRIISLMEDFESNTTDFEGIESSRMGDLLNLFALIRSKLKAESTPEERHDFRVMTWERNRFSQQIVRTRRADLKNQEIFPKRIVEPPIMIELAEDEKELFEEIDAFLREHFFPVHRRQLSSCLPAMKGLLKHGMEGFNFWKKDDEEISELEWYQMDEDEKENWRKDRLRLDEVSRKRAEELCDKFNRIKGDTKFDRLIEVIRELRDDGKAKKVIVFTRWVPTMDYFKKKRTILGDIRTFLVSGKDSEDSRENEMETFQNHGGFAVLFANDLVSEGVDLFAADCVINYDLMLNPQRIEQRIGRVDRIGQESENVRIINVIVKGGEDNNILKKILEPINAFEEALGPMADVIVRRHVKGKDIDDVDSIKLRKAMEHERRLEEAQGFVGVEDLLDERIRVNRANTRNISPMQQRALMEGFLNLISDGSVRLLEREGESFEPEGLENVHKDTICELLQDEERRLLSDIRLELANLTTISFRPDLKSDYIPFSHPLMQIAIRSLEANPWSTGVEQYPISVNVDGHMRGSPNGESLLVLVEYAFSEGRQSSREWRWWQMGADDKEPNIVNSLALDGVISNLKEERSRVCSSDEDIEIPPIMIDAIGSDCIAWYENETAKDRVSRKQEIEGAIRRAWAEHYHNLNVLESPRRFRILSEEIETLRTMDSTLMRRIELMERELEEIQKEYGLGGRSHDELPHGEQLLVVETKSR